MNYNIIIHHFMYAGNHFFQMGEWGWWGRGMERRPYPCAFWQWLLYGNNIGVAGSFFNDAAHPEQHPLADIGHSVGDAFQIVPHK